MPELPEVETSLRGIAPSLIKQSIQRTIVHQRQLRYPVSEAIETNSLINLRIINLHRRGKYIIFDLSDQTHLIVHLGMSGTLRLTSNQDKRIKHDHLELHIKEGPILRYNDPRRFGCFLHTSAPAEDHSLLNHLGIEPLDDEFNAHYLHALCKSKCTPIKTLLMNPRNVVGVGNIYANEALFETRIHPSRPANTLSSAECGALCTAIQQILQHAIAQGGTTLKDYVNAEGTPGYFSQQLNVYGRHNLPCLSCHTPIKHIRQAQRSTFYCPQCQH